MIGKRSADAEPEAEPFVYTNGYVSPYTYGAYNPYTYSPYTYGAHLIGKRSADAEPEAEPFVYTNGYVSPYTYGAYNPYTYSPYTYGAHLIGKRSAEAEAKPLFTPTALFLPTPMVPTGLQPMLEFTDQLIPCGDKSIPNQMASTQLLTRTRTLKIIIINNIHQNTLCKAKLPCISSFIFLTPVTIISVLPLKRGQQEISENVSIVVMF